MLVASAATSCRWRRPSTSRSRCVETCDLDACNRVSRRGPQLRGAGAPRREPGDYGNAAGGGISRLALSSDELRSAGDRRPAVPPHHGHTRGPFHALRHPAAAAVVVRELRRLCPDLLSADRRAALLLLVHRRPHRERVPVPVEGRSTTVRSDDYRIQSSRHVRGRPHSARAEHVPRCVHRL